MTVIYPTDYWENYATVFHTIMPSSMTQMNAEVAKWMSGIVADYGCGSGKAIPFIFDQPQVTSYIGIDMCTKMAQLAEWVLTQFPQKQGRIILTDINDTSFAPVDSAISINNYYSWPNPESILTKIFQQLKENGIFVLATINTSIDMPKLLQAADKEMIGHPHWEKFKEYNITISENKHANFIELNDLIQQVSSIGFKVLEAHTHHYNGGLNFIVMKKG